MILVQRPLIRSGTGFRVQAIPELEFLLQTNLLSLAELILGSMESQALTALGDRYETCGALGVVLSSAIVTLQGSTKAPRKLELLLASVWSTTTAPVRGSMHTQFFTQTGSDSSYSSLTESGGYDDAEGFWPARARLSHWPAQ